MTKQGCGLKLTEKLPFIRRDIMSKNMFWSQLEWEEQIPKSRLKEYGVPGICIYFATKLFLSIGSQEKSSIFLQVFPMINRKVISTYTYVDRWRWDNASKFGYKKHAQKDSYTHRKVLHSYFSNISKPPKNCESDLILWKCAFQFQFRIWYLTEAIIARKTPKYWLSINFEC